MANQKNPPDLPRDVEGESIALVPAIAAIARTVDATISTSTQVNLNASTKLIEVTALDQGVYLKWGTTAVTSSNFDCYIHADATRHYVVPDGISAITVIERTATAGVIVIEY